MQQFAQPGKENEHTRHYSIWVACENYSFPKTETEVACRKIIRSLPDGRTFVNYPRWEAATSMG